MGDRIRFDGRTYTVAGVHGRCLTLADTVGGEERLDVVPLVRDPGFSVVDQVPRASGAGPSRPAGNADGRASWWVPHIVEVLTGLPPGAPPGTRPRPGFDPASTTLGEREEAKSEELRRAGMRGTSARTVRRKRQRYEAEGPAGLADGRSGRREEPGSRWDPRLLDTVRHVMAESSENRPAVESVRRQVERSLEAEVRAGTLVLPSRTTFHRLYAEWEAAGRIDGPDRWPGRQVVVDTVRLPPLPLPHRRQRDLELLVALDVDTEVILTAVVREDSRALDGAALLARMWLPADHQADWLCEHDIAVSEPQIVKKPLVPLVRPQTLFLDRTHPLPRLADACRRHGVLVRSATETLPHPRHHAEFVARQLAGQFSAFLRSMHGDRVRDAGWPVDMVQDLLDTWTQEEWNHGELHRQLGEFALPQSPNSRALRYVALTERAGWVATPPSPAAFVGLLPASHERVTVAGLHVDGRRYDSPALGSLRRRHPVEVRRDPYATRQVWVRTPEGSWSAVPATVSPVLPLDRIPIRPVSASGGHPPLAQVPTGGSGRIPTADAPDSSRIEYHAGLPLHTPDVVDTILRGEELALLNERSSGTRRGLVVGGGSGAGKTTALLALGRSYTARARLPAGSARRPAVYVRVAPATTPHRFLAELARQVSAPVRARARTTDLAYETSKALDRLGTGLILVDEFEYLHAARGSATSLSETMDYLCDRLPVTFVFAGRSAALPRLAPSRRLLHLTLGPLPHDASWVEYLAQAEEALRLRQHAQGALPSMADHLHRLTGGWADRVGYLLRSGAIRAIRDGTECLTRVLFDDLAAPWRDSHTK
ncbi:AAA family ATPase [Streptomyces sp. NPDC058877]|uniref:AAA family ATPase n=2 Tax=unclassified Streptomyces TaxID=2593676 RepID=UPI0036AE3D14